jgi:hypothetical protein
MPLLTAGKANAIMAGNKNRGDLEMDKLWLKQYPAGVPAEIDVNHTKPFPKCWKSR